MRKKLFPLLCFLSLLSLAPLPAPAAETYTIDTVHSAILFKVPHNGGIAYSAGRFNEFSGNISFDSEAPEKSSVNVEINSSSIDTANAKRDDHLRGPDFFNSKEFATITFKSTKVEKSGDKTYTVTGDLTLLGTTKSVTAECEVIGQNEKAAGGMAVFTFNRSDFGMKYGLPDKIGDQVDVTLLIEAQKK